MTLSVLLLILASMMALGLNYYISYVHNEFAPRWRKPLGHTLFGFGGTIYVLFMLMWLLT